MKATTKRVIENLLDEIDRLKGEINAKDNYDRKISYKKQILDSNTTINALRKQVSYLENKIGKISKEREENYYIVMRYLDGDRDVPIEQVKSALEIVAGHTTRAV